MKKVDLHLHGFGHVSLLRGISVSFACYIDLFCGNGGAGKLATHETCTCMGSGMCQMRDLYRTQKSPVSHPKGDQCHTYKSPTSYATEPYITRKRELNHTQKRPIPPKRDLLIQAVRRASGTSSTS